MGITYALNSTSNKKKALKEIIADYREYCIDFQIEWAEFKVDKSMFKILSACAKENDLMIEFYENSKGYRIMIMTRDIQNLID